LIFNRSTILTFYFTFQLIILSACVSCSLGLPISEADADSEAYSYSNYYRHNQRQPRHYGYGSKGNHGSHGSHKSHGNHGSHSRHIGRYGYKALKSVEPTQRHSKPVPNLPITNLRHLKPLTNHPGVSRIQKPKILRVQSIKQKPIIHKVSKPNNVETIIHLDNPVRDILPDNTVRDVSFVPNIEPLNILTDPHLDNLVVAPIPSSPIIPPPEPVSSSITFPSRISTNDLIPFSFIQPEFPQQIEPEPAQSLDLPPEPSFEEFILRAPEPSFDEFVPRTPFLPEPVPAVPGQNSVSILQPIAAVPELSDDTKNDSQISFLNPNDFNDENDGQVSFLQPVAAVPGLPVSQF